MLSLNTRIWIVIGALVLFAADDLRAGEVIPVDGMIITEDTTFAAGVYELPNGVSIGASNITLDMNGAELVGVDFENFGVSCSGFTNVTIRNGVIRNYYYGIFVKNGDGVQILDNNLSDNWVDPLSLTDNPPFLNINVGPDIGDRTNLGGGLFVQTANGAAISGNTLINQENGMDLYFVTDSTISDNNASDNTGWGIHLHCSTGNVISNNVADRCTRTDLKDSAGVLVVVGSHKNQFLDNCFRFSGDGFFIGNEGGCPSNDNLIQGNDGSFAGANAFEATFSSGNQFIDNIADASRLGFWLGYSHTGNVIRGNSIRFNSVSGIEIEHGQGNIIEANEIIGNGGSGIVLRTDGNIWFPPKDFPCLELPDQALSNFYTIKDNRIESNFGLGIELTNTTDSTIVNNLVAANLAGTAASNGADNVWSVEPIQGENIVGGAFLGGNYWDNYQGKDVDKDGLGDTDVPYTNDGLIAAPGDPHPLIGDPEIEGFENPMTLCNWNWTDFGANTYEAGGTFNTSNGAHFATDGTSLYLLEGTNSTRLNLFDPAAHEYEPKADLPEVVQDGGGFQYGGGAFFATVGLGFDANDGSGNGSRLYAFDPKDNSWERRADTTIDGSPAGNEALAYDPVNHRLYATIVNVIAAADPTLRQTLAMYDVDTDTWLGATSPSGVAFDPGSEAEYLDGRIYVWRGGFNGGVVNGIDSELLVYDIADDTWSVTPSLQAAGVAPGFLSGALDLWGLTISADVDRQRLFVIGGEINTQLYVFDVRDDTWLVGPIAIYDGGWGDGMEYVAASQTLYQLDGRNALNLVQGTAAMTRSGGDIDGDGGVGTSDLILLLGSWGPCDDTCCPADLDEDGLVGTGDLIELLGNWGPDP